MSTFPDPAKSISFRTKSLVGTLWQLLQRLPEPGGDAATSPARALSATARWLQSHFATGFTALVVVLVLIVGSNQYLAYQTAFASWDILFLSGLVTFLVGFQLALTIPARLRGTLARLADRDVLASDGENLAAFEQRLDATAHAWGWRSASLVVVLLVLATVLAVGWQDLPEKALLLLAEIPIGAVAGCYLGRMAVYGLLGSQLARAGLALRVKPGHVDGCAGLKPIGDFYFYQAMVTALPAVFVAVWLFLMPVWPGRAYDYWREPYLGLLPFAILFEMFAFLVPVWSFHREMARQKVVLRREADLLSRDIARVETALASAEVNVPREVLKDQLTYLRKQYWDLETMPTWPMDPSTRRGFTANNVALLLPLITRVVGLDRIWPDVGKTLAEILKGLGGSG